ncbi:unnamed protein product [Brugia pahangi]|uniref:Uncharacterized protein n=1 Tax=Brugia pahangi TaxID=6280 RepID=A0A0N4T2D3_BRUPA|nr:unnamed protein product [Brugia pahangi]
MTYVFGVRQSECAWVEVRVTILRERQLSLQTRADKARFVYEKDTANKRLGNFAVIVQTR